MGMNEVFMQKLHEYQEIIEASLPMYFIEEGTDIDLTKEAALYSLQAGGKRIRPALLLGTAEMLSVPVERALPFAAALEMIHTYSLIHDDLPCMDNDDLRRGKPTCHVKYTEAIALLAGDALLNRAYEVCLSACMKNDTREVKASCFLSRMAGSDGMIGGQTIDILSENKIISSDELHTLHAKKTGCLLKAPLMIPFALSEHGDENHDLGHNLEEYASHIGLAFQIKDDLLDVTSSKDVLGKSIGKDAACNKSTFVTLFGQERASDYLQQEITSAMRNLERIQKMGFSVDFLSGMTDYLFTRDR